MVTAAPVAAAFLAVVVWAGLEWRGVREVEADWAANHEFVRIHAGCFEMGSPDSEPWRYPNEGPVHNVCLKAFDMARFDVTQADWRRVMIFPNDRSPGRFKGRNLPVESVSWSEAQRFLWLMTFFGRGDYRLPTEAEWEYAARAGKTASHYWGGDIDDGCAYENIADQALKKDSPGARHDYADCDDGFGYTTAPVDSMKPNPWGLYHMLGNVANLVEDCFSDSYRGAPIDGSADTSGTCASRVARGGSWIYDPRDVRAAIRYDMAPGDQADAVGFRVVKTASPRN